MKQFLQDNLKNLPGWRTSEKLVIFSVDDYGNIRLDSAQARANLESSGMLASGRFDQFDSLETRADLEQLFEMLDRARDHRGSSACFTAYTVCVNPDFSQLNGSSTDYRYETLPETFDRLSACQSLAYSGAWPLWQDGVRQGFLHPQFHGREHYNLDVFNRKLKSRDPMLMASLKNNSVTGQPPDPSMPNVGFTASFGVQDGSELQRHRKIINEGLELFRKTFGFSSITFTPPAMQIHPELYSHLESLGVLGIDKPLRCVRRLNRHKSIREHNFLGPAPGYQHFNLVRNVLFEPCRDRTVDPVGRALKQIEAAFRWRKPAIISSHRVNFCGHIDPANRDFGLQALAELLDRIVKKWPEVRFVTAPDLLERMEASH